MRNKWHGRYESSFIRFLLIRKANADIRKANADMKISAMNIFLFFFHIMSVPIEDEKIGKEVPADET